MRRIRRKRNRQAAELARLFIALDAVAGRQPVPLTPRRRARLVSRA